MPVERVFYIITFAFVMFGLGWFGVRLLVRRGRSELRREARRLGDISSLSISEASVLALAKLSDRSLFEVAETHDYPNSGLERLSPELRSVFRRFEAIAAKNPARTTISRSDTDYPAASPGYVRIGSIGRGTDFEGEIVVRPGEEAIYELYRGEQPDPTFGTYKSVYHWILAVSNEVSGSDSQ
jgi:hypothetical protein